MATSFQSRTSGVFRRLIKDARPPALFIVVLGASVSVSLITDHIEGDMGYRQPYLLVYFGQSLMSLVLPLHLWYLSRTSNVPVSLHIATLKYTLSEQFPKRSSPGINYASLGRTALLSTIGYTGATLLWSIAVVFAPIADVTSIWATGAFWTYTFSVVISLRNGRTTGRPAYKWESRKLVAVVMAAAGVTAVVYGGHTQSELSSGPNILTATFVGAGATFLGDTLALCSALCSASWNVWYDRCIALPEEEKSSQPPTPQSSDNADQEPTEYQPLRSDDTERVLPPMDSLSPPYSPHTLPFGLHENFFTWLVGFTTLFVLWIPIYLAYALKLGPPLELPPNPRTWLLVGLTAVMNLIYNAGSLILLGIWGPVLMTVGNLLNVALVLAADALFRKGMETITAGTLLGSAMIVGAFGILACEGLK